MDSFNQKWIAAAVLAAAMGTSQVLADCVDGASVVEVQQAYSQAEALLSSGKPNEAVRFYLQAQNYVCGATNPVASAAAKKAAPIALQLAQALEAKGKLYAEGGSYNRTWDEYGAYDWFEAGGHYKEADRVLMAALRADPRNANLYEQAKRHFSERALPSFQSNHQTRLSVTGGYVANNALYQEVLALPAKNVAAILAQEAQAFSEQYLTDTRELYHRKPAHALDFAAIQQAGAAEQAYQTKWRQDPLQTSFDRLDEAQAWAQRADYESGQQTQLHKQIQQRAVERGDRLLAGFAGTPPLLDSAIQYYQRAERNEKAGEARRRAEQLGDEAMSSKRFDLAASFYQLADNMAKLDQANAKREEQLASQQEPLLNQQQQAEELQRRYSDPAQLEQMRKKAEEIRSSFEKTPAQQKQFQNEQDELEDALGM